MSVIPLINCIKSFNEYGLLISPYRKCLRIYNNRELEFIYKKLKKIKYYKKNKKIEDILKKIVFPLIKGCYGRLKFLSVHFRINLDNTLFWT